MAALRGPKKLPIKSDWALHQNAAPFNRDDQLLEIVPIGAVIFPDSGISNNMAVKAQKLGRLPRHPGPGLRKDG